MSIYRVGGNQKESCLWTFSRETNTKEERPQLVSPGPAKVRWYTTFTVDAGVDFCGLFEGLFDCNGKQGERWIAYCCQVDSIVTLQSQRLKRSDCCVGLCWWIDQCRNPSAMLHKCVKEVFNVICGGLSFTRRGLQCDSVQFVAKFPLVLTKPIGNYWNIHVVPGLIAIWIYYQKSPIYLFQSWENYFWNGLIRVYQ